MTGAVTHFEIPADDIERAKAFYSKTFGWKMTDFPGMEYTLVGTAKTNKKGNVTQAGAINGGMGKRQGPLKAITVTIWVDDIDKALATVKKHGGGVVMKKSPVADMGFTAYFKDTEGNVVGLWQNV